VEADVALMPSQSGEIKEISAACGRKEEKEEEKKCLEGLHPDLLLIYLVEGINGPSF